MTVVDLIPGVLRRRLETAVEELSAPDGVPRIDFTRPAGEPALAAADSVSWQVFKNPVSLFIGGVTAVILELAEPRIRSGVWDHTSFRSDPLPRMKRTGLAAMVTVYSARSVAEQIIAGIGRMHGRVAGVTPAGQAYRADDPELLNWVQATASFGFLEAYAAFVRPMTDAQRDSFYAEAAPAAALYGAVGAPQSLAQQQALFDAMLPSLEPSPVVFDFLDILGRTPVLPAPLRPLQNTLTRAAVEIISAPVRAILGLDPAYGLRFGERTMIRSAARLADRVTIASAPSAQACRRLGLPPNYLQLRA